MPIKEVKKKQHHIFPQKVVDLTLEDRNAYDYFCFAELIIEYSRESIETEM